MPTVARLRKYAVTLAADASSALGGERPTSPDQKKCKMMNPFKNVLPNGEASNLIETVRATGLRLNSRPEIACFIPPQGGDK